MNLKNFARGASAGALMALGATSAGAAVIDFTSAATGTSGSIGSITWTMSSNGVLNNSQAFDGNVAPSVAGLSFETDGYGVGARDDEITTTPIAFEWIEIAFSAPVIVNAFYFLDLFVANNGQSYEVGEMTVDGSSVLSVSATDIAGSGAGGFAGSVIKPIVASVLRFTVQLGNDNNGSADGALAGVDVAPVPVPAAGLMMLGGLGAVAAVRRRRRAA